mmetsp:Transcript_107645/g.273322  ORF Transcript_107645/g.273322 Transcript_107645/m.273322 type:complete len:390 (+) Transcript_107645:70-1239(+)
MVAREIIGMLLIMVAGIGVTSIVILSVVIKELGMPYYTLVGVAIMVVGLCEAGYLASRGEFSKVESRHIKWVWMRGVCGTGTLVFGLMAVQTGAPVGDVSALGSVNAVVAALLGRAFLGEPLGALHIAAVGLSILGAFLVSKPQALLGLGPSGVAVPWLGYLLAVLSGILSGGSFIASRKAQAVSPLMMSFSVCIQETPVIILLPLLNLVDEVPLTVLVGSPLQGASVFAGLMLLVFISVAAMSAGSQLCPAAAGSTIYTSVSMALGFTAQIVLSSETPDVVTLSGASSMLLAVCLMAISRRWYSPKLPSPQTLGPEVGTPASAMSESSGAAAAEVDDEDENESLASFVAAEFSGLSASPKAQAARQRRAPAVAAAVCPPVQAIGWATA